MKPTAVERLTVVYCVQENRDLSCVFRTRSRDEAVARAGGLRGVFVECFLPNGALFENPLALDVFEGRAYTPLYDFPENVEKGRADEDAFLGALFPEWSA